MSDNKTELFISGIATLGKLQNFIRMLKINSQLGKHVRECDKNATSAELPDFK